MLHVHDHLALLLVQLHVCHSPGRLDVQDPRVQFLVTHGSSVAVLPQKRRPSDLIHTKKTRKEHDLHMDMDGHPSTG